MKRPFLNVLILLTLAGPRFAHSQSILINEPVEWRERRPIILVAGKPVRIAGSVTHPAGVAKLFINGREVAIRQDKAYPDYYEFEKILPADSVPAEVTIRITSAYAATVFGPMSSPMRSPIAGSPTASVAVRAFSSIFGATT